MNKPLLPTGQRLSAGAIISQMQKSYPKQMGKTLRALATLAYERELGSHLGELRLSFSQWAEHKISVHELSDRIHRFHDGPSRDLFSVNQQFKADFLVARAIALGVLTENEVPSDIREVLSTQIESLRSLTENDGPGQPGTGAEGRGGAEDDSGG